MNAKVETLEKSMVKLTIEVDAAKFEEGMQKAYNKNKGKMNIQGFRKGKAPRQIIEKTYGPEVFYDDAANYCIPEAYDNAVEEASLEVVSRPEIDAVQIEKGKSFIFTAVVAVKPEITLGEYKGIEVEKREVEVTDEDIDVEIQKVQEQNSRIVEITDRRVADKDIVNIDFEGFVGGVAFEGGKGENFDLTIGSNSFIDTFENQLIDKEIGEEVDVLVTFPEEYHQEALQGMPATFKVKINSIKAKELPEVDDDFAKDVSDFETLSEYKDSIKADIADRKKASNKKEMQEEVLTKLIEASSIELPEPMVDLEAENMSHEFAHRLQYQGLDIEQYFNYTGQNFASLKEAMKKEADNKIKVRLVLEGVSKAENLTISDEEYNEEVKKMAELYQMEIDKLLQNIGEDEKESIMQDMLNQKALDLITEASVEK